MVRPGNGSGEMGRKDNRGNGKAVSNEYSIYQSLKEKVILNHREHLEDSLQTEVNR